MAKLASAQEWLWVDNEMCHFSKAFSEGLGITFSKDRPNVWGMRSSLTLKYLSKKRFKAIVLSSSKYIFSSGNINKAYSLIPWVHKNPTMNCFTRKNQLWMTFTFSWDSVHLMSLSQLLPRGINTTKLYKSVIFPEVSEKVHCSLSDIKRNWISCYPCYLTKISRHVCFKRSQDDESWRDERTVFRSCRLICNNLITSAYFLECWS